MSVQCGEKLELLPHPRPLSRGERGANPVAQSGNLRNDADIFDRNIKNRIIREGLRDTRPAPVRLPDLSNAESKALLDDLQTPDPDDERPLWKSPGLAIPVDY